MSFHYFDPPSTDRTVSRAVTTVAPSATTPPQSLARTPYRNGGKRLLDLALCILSLPFVVPLVAVLALLVALTGHSPFYAQNRVGQHGRIFKMWKLRSMIHNSDLLLKAHLDENPSARAEWQRAQKLKSDPRITAFGLLLRRTSLDELPQIWNVLRGEMSLVGPRPMLISQEPLYPGRDYYDMRPGISGNWQVSARNTSSFKDRALYDAAYNEKMSFAEDLRILKDTFGVVLRAKGQ